MLAIIAGLLILLANLAVLGIIVKLYTEILKDRKFDVREVRSGDGGGRRIIPGTPTRQPVDITAPIQPQQGGE